MRLRPLLRPLLPESEEEEEEEEDDDDDDEDDELEDECPDDDAPPATAGPASSGLAISPCFRNQARISWPFGPVESMSRRRSGLYHQLSVGLHERLRLSLHCPRLLLTL